jgi:hypothetical protein
MPQFELKKVPQSVLVPMPSSHMALHHVSHNFGFEVATLHRPL